MKKTLALALAASALLAAPPAAPAATGELTAQLMVTRKLNKIYGYGAGQATCRRVSSHKRGKWTTRTLTCTWRAGVGGPCCDFDRGEAYVRYRVDRYGYVDTYGATVIISP